MKTLAKISALIMASVFSVVVFCTGTFAAKGGSVEKKRANLTANGFAYYTPFHIQFSFLKSNGFTYKGSYNTVKKTAEGTTLRSYMTYEKGNMTFIMPYEHKMNFSKFKTPSRD